MIRFSCPTCQNIVETADERAGEKIPCPACGQRLLIPPPLSRRNKTVLGKLIPDGAGSDFAKEAIESPFPTKVAAEPPPNEAVDPERISPPTEWGTSRRPRMTWAIAMFFVFVSLAVLMLFLIALKSRDGKSDRHHDNLAVQRHGGDVRTGGGDGEQERARGGDEDAPQQIQDGDDTPNAADGNHDQARARKEALDRALKEMERKHGVAPTPEAQPAHPRPQTPKPAAPPPEPENEPGPDNKLPPMPQNLVPRDPVPGAQQPVEILTLGKHQAWVSSLAFSHDGRFLVSGGGTPGLATPTIVDNSVRLWELKSGEQLRRLTGHTDRVRAVAFSRDDKHVLSAGDTTIRLWNVRTGKELRRMDVGGNGRVVFSPDGKRALCCGENFIRLLDLADGRELHRFPVHNDFVACAAFSPDGTKVASGGQIPGDKHEYIVRFWDVATQKELRRFQGEMRVITGLSISPTGQSILAVTTFEAILFDIKNGTEKARFAPLADSISLSRDGRRALIGTGARVATGEATVQLWDIDNMRQIALAHGHTGNVFDVAFSPDGQLAASGGSDTTVRVWHLPKP